ncbi:hypothetical protein [uncultured Moraxella sp.]|uniref:hypothetical protein n=1 Tax=uncultured Moraxella sp. TaxID=263769 RepID=UPI0025FB6816|nr:hypothetical protein [uncultured Moraxella sp.]
MSDELTELLQAEKSNPNDDQLLSKIAFYYLANPDGRKDLEYFKKAYEANPNIKNTHNYAFWAYYEYGETDLALPLFKALIAKNPKSFYPYIVYANLLFSPSDYSNTANIQAINNHSDLLIELYQKSIILFNNTPQDYQNSHQHELAYLYNNLANFYVAQQDFTKADECYNQAIDIFSDMLQDKHSCLNDESIKDYLCSIALNKVRLNVINNDLATAKKFLVLAESYNTDSRLDIAYCYALMGDYQQSYQTLNGKFNFHFSWTWLCYAIWQTDMTAWQAYVKGLIDAEMVQIQEYQDELANCKDSEKQDIQDTIQYHQDELAQISQFIDTPPTPELSAKEQCLADLHYFYKCWLLGCENCHNLTNDDNEWIGA